MDKCTIRSSLRMALLGRLATFTRIMTIKFQSRGLLTGLERGERDLLLREVDLPPRDPNFLTYMPKRRFINCYSMDIIPISDRKEESQGKQPNIPNIRRYAIVLPLFTALQAIPIPFILDSGAPEFIYLCSAAVRHLERLEAIKETTGVYPYQLLGTFGPEDQGVHQPFVDVIPRLCEEHAPDDVRLNLLGIKAMKHFGLFLKIAQLIQTE